MSYELAWAAGLFDGEGCTYISRSLSNKRNPFIRMTITMKNPDVLKRFSEAVGIGKVTGPNVMGLYNWSRSGSKAYFVFEKIKPYLSEEKCTQFNRKEKELIEYSI